MASYSIKVFSLVFCVAMCMTLKAQQLQSVPPAKPAFDSTGLFFKSISGMCESDKSLFELRKNSVFKAMEDRMNRQIRYAVDTLSGDTMILPVVVHIINTNPAAISDAQVIAGIALLNDAFGKTGVYSGSAGADTKIRFCLSKKDPDGGNSNGITRTTSFLGTHLNKDIEDDKLKNLIQWDPLRYINIWLVASVEAEAYVDFSCGNWYRLRVAAYATMPPGGDALDGIVIPGFGTVLAHEMGHYLGLYHTFSGGCTNNNCDVDGDMVCDTPPDNSVRPSAGCGSPENSCHTDTLSGHSHGFFTTDVPDQISNFMDYGNTACSNQFTQGQADRMKKAVTTQRSGLLVDECAQPCAQNILANFTRNIFYPVPGDSITFTNTSSVTAHYQWYVNDTLRDSTVNFGYIFNSVGKSKVTLKAFDTLGCFAAYSDFIITNCGVTAGFYTNKQTIASRAGVYTDSIIFTNRSYRGITYQWLISNNVGMAEHVEDTTTNLTYVFPTPGTYQIRLVATNGGCSDTSEFYTVLVLDPTPDAIVYGDAWCYQQTKISVIVCITNFGKAPIPIHTPVTFYDSDPRFAGAHKLLPTFYTPGNIPGFCAHCYTHIVDVTYPRLDRLYMVVADSGNAIPVVLPNTPLIELNYFNNFNSISNIRFRASAIPATATLLPGDTLQLNGYGSRLANGNPNTYLWSTAYRLSCTTCSSPYLYADSDRIKRVIVTSAYGCIDTAYVDIRVPPADDYTIHIDSTLCISHDSMTVRFTVRNAFIRGVIPKNLKVSFYNGDPTTAAASILLPVFSVPDTTFARQQTFTAKIKIMPEGNLYGVVNDSTLLIPIALPNTPKLEKDYSNNINSIYYLPNKTTIAASICQGQNYAGHSSSGIYVDTLAGYNGCDSIRTLDLTVKPVFATSVTTTICQGQNYAGHTTTGTFVDVYPAINGCDSTRTLHLTVLPTFATTVTTSICNGQNYAGHTTSGTYIDIYPAGNGCDSTRTLHLTVLPTFATTVTASICEGQNYAGHTVTGTYVDVYPAVNGCDSTRTLQLTVKPTFFTSYTISICEGQSYAGHTVSGTYVDVYPAMNGCDSTRTLELTVNPVKFTTVTTAICQGENYAGHTASGTYVDTYTTIFGCDSTRTLHLTVKPTVSTSIAATICQDDNYAGHTTAGTYVDVYTAINGCDSTRTLQLTVNPKKFTTINAAICNGESYLAAGHLQTTSGIYSDTLLTYLMCDSIITTNLTVNPLPTPDLGKDRNICIGDVMTLNPGTFVTYLWQDGSTNSTFNTNLTGQYFVMVSNTFGCKASDTMYVSKILSLPANFLPPDSSLCRGNLVQVKVPGYSKYLWNTGSTVPILNITQSGTYTLQVTDVAGCKGTDSIKVLYHNCAAVWIPNSFSPNADGLNDIFKPIFPAPVANYRLQIYNRWGFLVFESTNPSIGWDGKYKSEIQPVAAYVYIITFRDIDGLGEQKTGIIMLVR